MTTDEEGDSDSESEESAANGILADSGVAGLASPVPDDLAPHESLTAEIAQASMENSIKNHVENSVRKKIPTENSMETCAYEADFSDDGDEYIDEDEMGGGFEEGLPS